MSDNENTCETPEESQAKLLHYSSDLLAKLINEEYKNILIAERTNLPRARAIGEKLTVLKGRADHGEWKTELAQRCPQISYVTATRYMRVYRLWLRIEEAAARKGIATIHLTIDGALELVAKPKTTAAAQTTSSDEAATTNTGSGEAENTDSGDDDGEADSATESDADAGEDWHRQEDAEIAKEYLQTLAVDDLITMLREVRDDDLLELTTRLAQSLEMTLMSLAKSEALMEALAPAE
jgi:hypothetical protein